jgi:hypothetical protein
VAVAGGDERLDHLEAHAATKAAAGERELWHERSLWHLIGRRARHPATRDGDDAGSEQAERLDDLHGRGPAE